MSSTLFDYYKEQLADYVNNKTSRCNPVEISVNSFFKGFYFDSVPTKLFGDPYHKSIVAGVAGMASFMIRDISNKCLPNILPDKPIVNSIAGGFIGGGFKYWLKGNNIFIGMLNNAAYEFAGSFNYDPNLTTYLIEIPDEISSNYLKSIMKGDPFYFINSITTGFTVSFVINGIANDIIPLVQSGKDYVLDVATYYLYGEVQSNETHSEL